MASIIFSSLVSEIVGSAGTNTFARNKGGIYVKERKTSANPQSSYQQLYRLNFSTVAQTWRTLQQSERDAWQSATINFPYQNRLGLTKYYSGFQLFQKFSTQLLVLNYGITVNPPTPYLFPIYYNFQVVQLEPNKVIVRFDTDVNDNNLKFALYASQQTSAGQYYCSSAKYKYLTLFDFASNGAADLSSIYASRCGGTTTGQKVFFKLIAVNTNSGIVGLPLFCSGIIA